MTALVLLDHAAGDIKQGSRSAIAAASQLGVEVHVLVAGADVAAAAAAAARIAGVARVHTAEDALYAHALAEPLAALIAELAADHSHILAAATATGKNVLPRVAALLDVQPISDIVAVEGADTFVRPIYAGSALATVRSSDAIRVITVRASAFEPARGGRWRGHDRGRDRGCWRRRAGPLALRLGRAQPECTRPELAAARVVVSGGRGMGSGENFCAARSDRRQTRGRGRRLARGGRQRLRAERLPGGPDRQDRGPRALSWRSASRARSSISPA